MDILFGDYRLRPHERELIGPGGAVDLSARSFDLLAEFLARPGELLDKAALFDAVWPGVVVEENTLQVHISALRKALGPGLITTVHGRGYKYVGPEPRPDEGAPAAAAGGNIGRFRADCVAREAEIDAIARLLGQHRLVSILGTGGVGKTTLAVAVAESLEPRDGGVWMIDLAGLEDGEFIESVLIQTLAVPFRVGSRSLDSIVDHLRPTSALLVFDNCEHLRGAAARVIRRLLAEAPDIRILATSQVPLALPEEHAFRLLPFAVATDDAQLGDDAAVRFLVHCYESFGEKLSAEEMPAVKQLCRRLDGVALPIKMAAARAATVGVEMVDRQLEQQLADLAADWDPALARHRSLAASLAWSYDLLEPNDQRTLRALSVFNGSFSLAAAGAVAGEGAEPRVAELVRRSLVIRDSHDRSRYRLLDSTRHFGLDKLAEAGEEVETRNRHAAFVIALFTEGIDLWETTPDARWNQMFRPEGDNLRAALAWTRSRADWPAYVDLAANSYRYFIEEQLGAEGLQTIEAGMPLVGAVSPESAARLQLALGEICRFNATDRRGREGLVPAVAYFRTSDDLLRYAQSLVLLTWITIFFRPEDEAGPLAAELDALLPRLPVSKVKSWCLVAIGVRLWIEGQVAAGLARAEAGLAMHLDTGNLKGRIRSAINLCEMLHKRGDTERALRVTAEILPEARQHAAPLQLCMMLTNLAAYNFALGRIDDAAGPLHEAVRRAVPAADDHWHWCLLQGMAEHLAHRGAADTAAMILGFVDSSFDAWADGRQATEEFQRERILAKLAESLTPAAQASLMQQGAALSLFEADHLAGLVEDRSRLRL